MQLLKLKSFLGSYTKSYSLYHKYASQIEVQGNLYDLKHWITLIHKWKDWIINTCVSVLGEVGQAFYEAVWILYKAVLLLAIIDESNFPVWVYI